jgi:hypothetical protein
MDTFEQQLKERYRLLEHVTQSWAASAKPDQSLWVWAMRGENENNGSMALVRSM